LTNFKEIQKKYGEGVLVDASFLLDEEKVIIPVSPSLNVALRGGIPEGTVCTLSGKAGSGKSTTALQIAANAQKKEFGARKIFYADVECRLKKSNLKGIHDLDCSQEKFHVIRSTENKILTAEDYLNIVLDLMKTQPRSIFIIDSTSALCGLGEMTDEVRADFRNNGPKLLANFCRHIPPLVLLNKQILLITQHLITDTSGKGIGYHEDGGVKVTHQADIRMRIKYTERWNVGSGENEKQIGQILHWGIAKSNHGSVDKLESYLRYGYGLDDVYEYINLAIDLGVIKKGGSWFTYGEEKWQGQEKLYNAIKENPKLLEEIKSKVSLQ
jgi:recombination protein RecA